MSGHSEDLVFGSKVRAGSIGTGVILWDRSRWSPTYGGIMSWSLLDCSWVNHEWVPSPRPFGVYGLRCAFLGGNEWFRFPRHSVSGSTLLGLTWGLVVWKGYRPRVRLVLE